MATTNLEQTIWKLKTINPAIEDQYDMNVVKEKDSSVLHFRMKGYPPRAEKKKHIRFTFWGLESF